MLTSRYYRWYYRKTKVRKIHTIQSPRSIIQGKLVRDKVIRVGEKLTGLCQLRHTRSPQVWTRNIFVQVSEAAHLWDHDKCMCVMSVWHPVSAAATHKPHKTSDLLWKGGQRTCSRHCLKEAVSVLTPAVGCDEQSPVFATERCCWPSKWRFLIQRRRNQPQADLTESTWHCCIRNDTALKVSFSR